MLRAALGLIACCGVLIAGCNCSGRDKPPLPEPTEEVVPPVVAVPTETNLALLEAVPDFLEPTPTIEPVLGQVVLRVVYPGLTDTAPSLVLTVWGSAPPVHDFEPLNPVVWRDSTTFESRTIQHATFLCDGLFVEASIQWDPSPDEAERASQVVAIKDALDRGCS